MLRMKKIYTAHLKLTIPSNVDSYEQLTEMFMKKRLECSRLAQEMLRDAALDDP